MTEIAWLQNYLGLGAILFVLGIIGVLTRRNVIVIFLCIEMRVLLGIFPIPFQNFYH